MPWALSIMHFSNRSGSPDFPDTFSSEHRSLSSLDTIIVPERIIQGRKFFPECPPPSRVPDDGLILAGERRTHSPLAGREKQNRLKPLYLSEYYLPKYH
jgi:hypothetical protein